uniref:Uncharacterized protein n=1 Tax=Rhizophora mucronata TaxID=61149 RepID=A0A2P2ITQ4_RHIMU
MMQLVETEHFQFRVIYRFPVINVSLLPLVPQYHQTHQ